MKTIDARQLEVKHNVEAERFEVQLDGKLGIVEYQKDGATYIFTHTEVPPEYRGQGIADRIGYVALETAKAESAQVVPLCPFIKSYIKRHKEYQPLVLQRTHKTKDS